MDRYECTLYKCAVILYTKLIATSLTVRNLFYQMVSIYEFILCWVFRKRDIQTLVGFGLACAPVRCAHPSFSAHCHTKQGAARPPPIAAPLLIIRPPKINKINRTWAAHIQGIFLSTGPQRQWNMRSLAPGPPIAASLILSAIFWGQNVPVQPYGLTFSIFVFVFYSFSSLLFNFFLFISSYPSLLTVPLLILLIGTMLCLHILIFLYFKLFVLLWYVSHSEGFFEGAKPFLIHLGSKLMYTVRPYVLSFLFYPFLWFFLSFLLVTLFLFFSSYLSSYSSLP